MGKKKTNQRLAASNKSSRRFAATVGAAAVAATAVASSSSAAAAAAGGCSSGSGIGGVGHARSVAVSGCNDDYPSVAARPLRDCRLIRTERKDQSSSVLDNDPWGIRIRGGDNNNHNAGDKSKKKSSAKSKRKKTNTSSTTSNTKTDSTGTKQQQESSGAKHSEKKKRRGEENTTGSSSNANKNNKNNNNAIVNEILRCEDYYEILGLSSSSSTSTTTTIIQKAYRKRALSTHPDKTNGDRRAFDKVAEAYDVLSDDTKRQIYDRYGPKGLEQYNLQGSVGGGGGAGFGASTAEDLFKSFFGSSFFGSDASSSSARRQQATNQNKNRSVRYQLEVTLEDLYRGKIKDVVIAAPNDNSEEEYVYHPFYGLTRTSTRNPQQQKRTKILQVPIPRGSYHSQNIVLSGEMDFEQSDTPGDAMFSIQQHAHELYQRNNHDLLVAIKLTIPEAISGVFQRSLPFLNGNEITIGFGSTKSTTTTPTYNNNSTAAAANNNTNTMIQNGDVHVVRGYGMPKDASGNDFGDLYVRYEIQMPTVLLGSNNKQQQQQPQREGEEYRHPLTDEECQELVRLFRKLENKEEEAQQKSTIPPPQKATTPKDKEDDDKDNNDNHNNNHDEELLCLEKASLSDFGRASGSTHATHDSHHHHHEEEQQQSSHPFHQRQFFFSNGSGRSSRTYHHHNMFHQQQHPNYNDDDENVQCRQM